MAQSVKILFAIAIFFTYALQAYVPIEILWDGYLKEKAEQWQVKETQKQTMKYLAEYGLRTSLVISTSECESSSSSKQDKYISLS